MLHVTGRNNPSAMQVYGREPLLPVTWFIKPHAASAVVLCCRWGRGGRQGGAVKCW